MKKSDHTQPSRKLTKQSLKVIRQAKTSKKAVDTNQKKAAPSPNQPTWMNEAIKADLIARDLILQQLMNMLVLQDEDDQQAA